MTYIENIFDNYYKISLEDRITLIHKLYGLHKENKNEFQYNYSNLLNIIFLVTKKILQAQSFEQFYNSLNEKEKKEFQTQVYSTSESIKEWIWYVPESYENISGLLNTKYENPEENKVLERFVVNFDTLDEELDSDDIDAEKVINSFTNKYYYFAFNKIQQYKLTEEEKIIISKKYSKPLSLEFNKAIDNCSAIIRENINESTRSFFDSIPHDRQMYVIFELLEINQKDLDDMIENRQELRNRKKQAINSKDKNVKQNAKKNVKKRMPNANYCHN